MGWIKDFLNGKPSQEQSEVKETSLGTNQTQISANLRKWVDSQTGIIYRGTKKLPDGTVSITVDVPLIRKRRIGKKTKKNS